MPLRLAMLGMWHTHAEGIVRRVAENPSEFALVGFWDSDRELAEARRERWQAILPEPPRLFDSADALLAEPVDGVVVEGRVYENVALARQAIERGRPVLLEKPAGANLREFQDLAELARSKHLHVQMIYLFRYMAAVQELLTRTRRGELGHIYEFRARLPKDLESYDRYVDELSRYGGGIFFEMAGHMVDLAVALLGAPRRVTPFLAHHHTAEPKSFIDNGMAVLEFERALAVLEVSSLEVVPHTRRYEVYGTESALVIPHLGSGHLANKDVQAVELCRAGEPQWQRLEIPAQTLQIRDLREFAAVVRREKSPDFSIEHDLIVQEALLAASGMAP